MLPATPGTFPGDTAAGQRLRLGEALGLQHRDWHTGRGYRPFIEVVPQDGLPHGVRLKGQRYRRVFISDELDRLYGEHLWQPSAPQTKSMLSVRYERHVR